MWIQKARLANGHPFSASDDIYKAALDAIWAVTFPFDPKNSVINAQLELLTPIISTGNNLPADIDEPRIFPEAPTPPAQASILTLTESLEKIVMSPVPRLMFKFLSSLPYMRRAMATKEEMISTKEEMISTEIIKAKKRFTEGQKEEQVTRCAMDYILRREFISAEKENRSPAYDTRTIFDEVGFYLSLDSVLFSS